MFLDRNGYVVAPPRTDIVQCDGDLIEKYVVRLIKEIGNRKYVVAEEKFDEEPNINQIKWCLAKHKDASFAAVEKIYKLEDEDLPFN